MTPFERLARREFFGMKLGLDSVRALTAALGHPERSCPRVIIAGTNGKGSVAAITARALHAAGHRVGLYTSPHLVALTERFRVAERDTSPEALDAALATVFAAEDDLLAAGRLAGPVTYFELTTVAAFELFRAAGVEVAVLEVGLGGRLDATNVADAPVAAITSIGLDHMAQLGPTVEAIAAEKAGVIQPDGVVVSGVQVPAAARVVAEVAAARRATLIDVTADEPPLVEQRGLETWVTLRTPTARYGPLPLALRGAHQAANAAVAVRLLEALDARGISAPHAAIEKGLREACWPGRLQVVAAPGRPLLIIDGAHNADGAAALAHWLEAVQLDQVTLVTALMRDKDVDAVLAPLLARTSTAIVTRVLPPRGLEVEMLRDALVRLAPAVPVTTAATPAAALAEASKGTRPIVVAGSLFLAGAVLAALPEAPAAP